MFGGKKVCFNYLENWFIWNTRFPNNVNKVDITKEIKPQKLSLKETAGGLITL